MAQERLQQYYSSRVALDQHEVKRAQSLALDICTEIQGFLHSRHPDMPLGEMNLGGSLLDDLQVAQQQLQFILLFNDAVFHNLQIFFCSRMLQYLSKVFFFLCVCLYIGGQCRPCMSAGASTAGTFIMAPHSWGGYTTDTPFALDDPAAKLGIFPQRTQLLGQVITHRLNNIKQKP